MGSGTRHSLAEGQRSCLRRKSGVDDTVRRVGWIQFGECPAHVAGDEGSGQARNDAVGHYERPLEPHDLREGRGDRQGADQRLQLQCIYAEGKLYRISLSSQDIYFTNIAFTYHKYKAFALTRHSHQHTTFFTNGTFSHSHLISDQSRSRDELHAFRGRQDHIGAAVELLLGHPQLSLGAHH